MARLDLRVLASDDAAPRTAPCGTTGVIDGAPTASGSAAWADFEDRLGLSRRRVPFSGIIEATFRCNLNCVHCYVNLPAQDREAQERELRTDEWIRVIDEMADAGNLFLLFTGGEVLLRPDFERLYVHAVRRGLLVTIFTNGTMITDRIVALFDEYRPETVEITLYGATEATFDAVTRVPGSYRRCMQGVRRLLDHDVPLKLKTMAIASNRHEVEAMRQIAQDLGLRFRVDGQLNPRIDGKASQIAGQQISPDEAWAVDQEDPDQVADLESFCRHHARPQPGEKRTHVFSCGAGESAFTVDPYGSLLMCQLTRRSGFDLRRGSFHEGWNEHFPRLRDRRYTHNTKCPSCNLLSLCGNCAGAAELETGDIEGIVPVFCKLTHLRAHALMGDDCGHKADASCCLPSEDAVRPPGASALESHS